jgi:hypothetical protein
MWVPCLPAGRDSRRDYKITYNDNSKNIEKPFRLSSKGFLILDYSGKQRQTKEKRQPI